MSPVTALGTLAQVQAEVLAAGGALTQLVRPGAPADLRCIRERDFDAVRGTDIRHA